MKIMLLLLSLTFGTAAFAAPNIDELKQLQVHSMDDKTISLGTLLNNKPTYLKFWTTWCRECMAQMPHFEHIQQKFGKDIQVVGINLGINDDAASVNKVKEQFKLTMPMVIDGTGQLAKALEVNGTPYSILLDDQGKLVHTGYETSETLDRLIAFLAKHKSYTAKATATLNEATAGPLTLIKADEPTALFFIATWCDWYLAETRPAMSQACNDGQKWVNEFSKKYPQYRWLGVSTRMWTGDKELQEYREKHQVPFDMTVDASNETFLKWNIRQFPTLLIVKGDQELLRMESFVDQEKIQKQIESFTSENRLP